MPSSFDRQERISKGDVNPWLPYIDDVSARQQAQGEWTFDLLQRVKPVIIEPETLLQSYSIACQRVQRKQQLSKVIVSLDCIVFDYMRSSLCSEHVQGMFDEKFARFVIQSTCMADVWALSKTLAEHPLN